MLTASVKKTDFYERLEQKRANQAKIREGFSFWDKETYEALPFQFWKKLNYQWSKRQKLRSYE